MDHPIQRLRCSSQLGIALSAVFAAGELAREAHCEQIRLNLENLAEELIFLHRQILELPPQSSTALARVEDDLPF
jgi:hypothetical protein